MGCCLRYCKSTIFQANHNIRTCRTIWLTVVCDTAKVRFFKQITTDSNESVSVGSLFAILQKYDFSSKSQPYFRRAFDIMRCLRYCKSTIFQANHNCKTYLRFAKTVVCDTAKVRFFKQITTKAFVGQNENPLFAILQKYDFSSKSQQRNGMYRAVLGCLRYCKSTIFQANHNIIWLFLCSNFVVCDTAKVRFFKQITTGSVTPFRAAALFAILQKYDFSSKSQQLSYRILCHNCCLRYCKSTIFQANHN